MKMINDERRYAASKKRIELKLAWQKTDSQNRAVPETREKRGNLIGGAPGVVEGLSGKNPHASLGEKLF